MKYLDKDGVSHLWAKVKNKLGSKVDKVDGKGLSTNDYDATDKNKVDKIVLNGDGNSFLADDGTYKGIDLSTIEAKIEGLENLGQYVGTFDTKADIPTNVSDFDNITLNDFINIRADESKNNVPTRYIAKNINRNTGEITWEYDISFSSDVSGKMDKITNPTEGKILVDDGNGSAVDSDYDISELMSKVNNKIQHAESNQVVFEDYETGIILNRYSYSDIKFKTLNSKTTFLSVNSVFKAVYYFKNFKDCAEKEIFAFTTFLSTQGHIGIVNFCKDSNSSNGIYVTYSTINSNYHLVTNNEQTFTGRKLFMTIPKMAVNNAVPTDDRELTNKKYVDDKFAEIGSITNDEIDEICDDEEIEVASEETE